MQQNLTMVSKSHEYSLNIIEGLSSFEFSSEPKWHQYKTFLFA